jgi:hypothetical protein
LHAACESEDARRLALSALRKLEGIGHRIHVTGGMTDRRVGPVPSEQPAKLYAAGN